MTKKQWCFRWFFYCIANLLLALGITCNLKTGLGVSPLVSLPHSISLITGTNVGNMTLYYYALITILQLIVRGYRQKRDPQDPREHKKRQWLILLQIPFAIAFTRCMNVFSDMIAFTPQNFGQQLLVLAAAIVCTGIGAAISVSMRIIPNPYDGFVDMVGELSGKGMGFAKNLLDLINIAIAFFINLASGHFLMSIGLGTVCTVIFCGRVIALFNLLVKDKLTSRAGLSRATRNIPAE